MTTPIALLGTGLLGSAFAEAFLTRGGVTLAVWNRSREKALPLGALGARVADTPDDAVRGAKRVHLILLDDDSVDEIINVMRDSLEPDAIIIDHTTLLPARVEARAAALDAAGIEYLHCPVMMGPPAARTAKGTMFAAGPAERFARVKGALAAMTGELWYLGERADLAAGYKLAGNAMLFSITAGLADIFRMADALHIARSDILAVFDRVKTDSVTTVRGPRMATGDYNATFTLETARKDVRLMIESAASEPVPVLRAIADRMDDLLAAGYGGLDMGVMSKPGS